MLLFCGLLLLAQDWSASKPPALLALEESRRSMLSAEVHYSTSWSSGAYAGHELHYATRLAPNNDLIYEELGDEEGVRMRTMDDQPAAVSKQRLLRSDSGSFQYCEMTTIANYWRGRSLGSMPPPNDIRALGLNANLFASQSETISGAMWSFTRHPSANLLGYKERQDGPFHIVTVALDNGLEVVWYINEEKGWNAERIERKVNGKTVAQAVFELQEFEGGWFPATSRFGKDPENPWYIVSVQDASFNQPDHPRSFNPIDIGVEAGMQLTPQDIKDLAAAQDFLRSVPTWDGQKVTGFDEFAARVQRGEAEYGPTLKAIWAAEMAGTYKDPDEDLVKAYMYSIAPVRSEVSSWERYVRAFIERYQLDDQQSQKAMLILKDCESRAEQYLRANDEKFDHLRRDCALGVGADKLIETLSRLRAPVDDIFEKDLKPRLEQLPTRAQRKAAEARAEARVAQSQPAQQP